MSDAPTVPETFPAPAAKTEKAKKPKTASRTYPAPQHANAGKTAALVEILAPWQAGLAHIHRTVTRSRFDGDRFPKFMDAKPFASMSPLSQRQWRSVTNQALAATRSWEAIAKLGVGALITGSTLPDESRMWLYRINAWGAWWQKPGTKLGSTDEIAPPDSAYRLARHLIKQVSRAHTRPDLSRVRTMLMDGPIITVETSRTNTFAYWAKIATLTRGKPVLIPLASYSYLDDAAGELRHYAQVRVSETSQVTVNLIKKTVLAPARTTGADIGLDWGLNHMFATSTGQLLGNRIYGWLQERDTELLALTRALQKQGIKPGQNIRYKNLTRRIREYTTNEIGRILNNLTAQDIRSITVEKLDFRGGGLSRRLNRILNKTARATIETKLVSMSELHGIRITHVNPAYTSQQCAGCHNTDDRNRNGNTFRCRFCGRKCHADINAARMILGRSHDATIQLWMFRGTVKKTIDANFTQRWGSPPTGLSRRRETSSTQH